jgi:type I restriction enzyme S subunit
MLNLSPKLRFIEFSGDWKSKKLEDVGYVVNGLTYSPDNINNEGVLVLRSSNIKENQLDFYDNVYVETGNYNPVLENDILICVRNGSRNLIGKNALITKETEGVAFGAFMSVYRSELNKFIFQLFATDKYYKTIHENLGATINSINNSDLKLFEFYFPLKEEQQKITLFLASIDNIINQFTFKKELLEQYKKGVMQQIFSKRIRFKDDNENEYANWKSKQLSEVAKFYSGGTPLTSKRQYFGGIIPFIRSGEINSYTTEQFITEEGLKNSSAKMVQKGDILYALYGATSGEVGISKINGAINQAVLCIKSNENHFFIYSFLQFEKENIIKTFLQGGQGNLSADIVKKLTIDLPCIEEQNKIANFLLAIDDEINYVATQITKNKEFKKGLLQRMFV